MPNQPNQPICKLSKSNKYDIACSNNQKVIKDRTNVIINFFTLRFYLIFYL